MKNYVRSAMLSFIKKVKRSVRKLHDDPHALKIELTDGGIWVDIERVSKSIVSIVINHKESRLAVCVHHYSHYANEDVVFWTHRDAGDIETSLKGLITATYTIDHVLYYGGDCKPSNMDTAEITLLGDGKEISLKAEDLK